MSYDSPPPPPGYGAGPYGQPAAAGTNQKSIWSLVLGILGLLCCGFFTGIPALILGNMARNETSQTGQSGSGMALAGMILGGIAIVWGIISLILALTGHYYFNFNSNN